MKTRLTKYLPILLLVAVFGCSESVDTITYDTPQVSEEGETELTIEVLDEDDAAVSGYDIKIEGPTSISESGVGNSQYTFTDLQSGTYSIIITKDGYIEAETETDIELSAESAAGYSSEVIVVLTAKAPPVSVDNSVDSVVETAPSRSAGAEGSLTELEIPAGTFPDGVAGDDGSVEISVTRYTPNKVEETDEGTVQDVFAFEPSGVELNNEVEVNIPVAIPEELLSGSAAKAGGSAAANAVDGISYVLMPGNIPVELQEVEDLNKVNGFRLFRAFAFINSFQHYRLVPNVRLAIEHGYTEPKLIAQSGCGEGVSAEYGIDTGGIRNIFRKFNRSFIPSRTITRSVSYPGVEGLRLSILVQNRTLTTSLIRRSDNQVVSEQTVNLPVIRFSLSTSNCHNSGG